MQTNDLIQGTPCPKCGLVFDFSFWCPGDPVPTDEMLANPEAYALVVCQGCLQILLFHPSTKRIRVAVPGDLDEVPPEVVDACRDTQRQLYFMAVRREAQKIAEKN